jgi:Flp pilus assembly protein TadG
MQTGVRQKGAELIEFTLALLPMLVIVLVLLDTAWAIFAKSSLQYAVRMATRRGVTLTAQQLSSGQCLTQVVKSTVQQYSFGMLTGDSNLSLIKVNYFKPPAADSTDPVTDVSAQPDGNTPGNVMQVSVQGFSLLPLAPRLFSWKDKPERNPLLISVYAADRIEPSRNPPCMGTAP